MGNEVVNNFNTIEFIYMGILIAIGLFFIVEFNTFIKLKNKIKQSKSSIEVYLNQRFDLIPNLVECVKEYEHYEENLLTNITKLRTEYNNQINKDLNKANIINSELNKIVAIAESTPNIKANEQFLNLQKSLIKMESQLQAARRIYNGDVTLYNTTIKSFPNNIFAKLFKFEEMELFKIEKYKKENIKF